MVRLVVLVLGSLLVGTNGLVWAGLSSVVLGHWFGLVGLVGLDWVTVG